MHCTLGIVSHTSNSSTLPMSRITEWVVGVVMLQISLKCLSMRMTLDLLREFANTEVLCLFHNCMWQSRHSEVNVYFHTLCEQIDGLFTFNGSPRSNLICVYVFRLRLLYLSERSTDTGTQLLTSRPVRNMWLSGCVHARSVLFSRHLSQSGDVTKSRVLMRQAYDSWQDQQTTVQWDRCQRGELCV